MAALKLIKLDVTEPTADIAFLTVIYLGHRKKTFFLINCVKFPKVFSFILFALLCLIKIISFFLFELFIVLWQFEVTDLLTPNLRANLLRLMEKSFYAFSLARRLVTRF